MYKKSRIGRADAPRNPSGGAQKAANGRSPCASYTSFVNVVGSMRHSPQAHRLDLCTRRRIARRLASVECNSCSVQCYDLNLA